MSMPDILPTGAMSSGIYVDYMIGYLDEACDSVIDDLGNYWGTYTMGEWSSQWARMTDDVDVDITDLNSEIVKIKAQVRMIDDAVGKI